MLGSCQSPVSARLEASILAALARELQAAATATCLAAVQSGMGAHAPRYKTGPASATTPRSALARTCGNALEPH